MTKMREVTYSEERDRGHDGAVLGAREGLVDG